MRHPAWTRHLALPALFVSIPLMIAAFAAGPALAVVYPTATPVVATAAASPTAAVPASLALTSRSTGTLGSFLVGPNGMTLYTLSSDTSTGGTCTGGCLANWPPLLVAPGGTVSGPSGATGTFATVVRADTGQTQVTYDGRPLFYFAHDTVPGDTNGQGIKAFEGTWLVAALSGAPSSIRLGSTTSATLGTYLTGPGGMTIYTLSSDPNNGTVCSGGCLANWPPLLIAPGGSTTGPTGATGSFGSFVRSDGTVQVTHDSRPLYYFAHDTAAGQTNGEGISALGGTWHVAAALAAVTSSPSATAAPTTAATLPPTSTNSGSGTGPGGVVPLVLLLVAVGAATMVAAGTLPLRTRRH
jgi:predicted lipoprotein with Yx(FWY)xxD motif